MIHRQLLGDVALAILIALPAVAFVQPQPAKPVLATPPFAPASHLSLTDRTATDHRVTLLG